MNACDAKDIAALIEAVLTSLAIVIGGTWTYFLFFERRQKFPRADIKHEVTHRHLDGKSVLLVVDTVISNKGDVLLKLRSAKVRIQQVIPPPDDIAKRIEKSLVPGATEIEWPPLFDREHNLELQIEPGESDRIRYDFVVPSEVKTVEIYTYAKNEKVTDRELGWGITTLYDVPKSH